MSCQVFMLIGCSARSSFFFLFEALPRLRGCIHTCIHMQASFSSLFHMRGRGGCFLFPSPRRPHFLRGQKNIVKAGTRRPRRDTRFKSLSIFFFDWQHCACAHPSLHRGETVVLHACSLTYHPPQKYVYFRRSFAGLYRHAVPPPPPLSRICRHSRRSTTDRETGGSENPSNRWCGEIYRWVSRRDERTRFSRRRRRLTDSSTGRWLTDPSGYDRQSQCQFFTISSDNRRALLLKLLFYPVSIINHSETSEQEKSGLVSKSSGQAYYSLSGGHVELSSLFVEIPAF